MKMNKLNNLSDKHKQFIDKNPWLNDIDFNNIDIVECKSFNLYYFIISLIENKVIQCNILIIDNYKDRFYYNGKHFFNKIKYVSENNTVRDILRDSKDNILFFCEDKYDNWGDYKHDFKPYDDFNIDIKVNKNDLQITYINENE